MLDFKSFDADQCDPRHRVTLDYLKSLPKFGEGIGLHRVKHVINAHGLDRAKVIKIVGTNGKGSVAAMLHAILTELGLKPGLFTSPHLLRFHERIKIGYQDIDHDSLTTSLEWLKQAINDDQQKYSDQFGAFEMFTILALHYFAQAGVEHQIFEAGIGGRFDAIRPLNSDLAAMTSLDLEHTQLLGHNLEEIAYNKIDVCADGTSLVIGRLNQPKLERQIKAYAQIKNLNLLQADDLCHLSNIRANPTDTLVDAQLGPWRLKDLRLRLVGKHQLDNLKIVLVLVLEYLRLRDIQTEPDRAQEAIRRALQTVRWPGRAEQIHHAPKIFVDVGHTPKAIQAFIASWPQLVGNQPILLVTGVSKNKAIDDIIADLVPHADEVICAQAYHMGADVARIEASVQAHGPDLPCHRAATVEEAVQRSIEIATKKGMAIMVAGSLFLALEFQMALTGRDPHNLWFF